MIRDLLHSVPVDMWLCWLLLVVAWAAVGVAAFLTYVTNSVAIRNRWELAFVLLCGPGVWLLIVLTVLRSLLRRKE